MIYPAARNEYVKRTIGAMSKEELIHFYFNEAIGETEQKICKIVLEKDHDITLKDLIKDYPEYFL